MPVISVKMTKEDGGANLEQKEALASGITELFCKIFNRPSSNAVVLIEELNTDNYYINKKSVTKTRQEQRLK